MRDALHFVRRWHKINMLQVDRSMVRIRRMANSQVSSTGETTCGWLCVSSWQKSGER